jgi:hypothetical protein
MIISYVTKNWFTTKVNVEETTPVVIPFRSDERKGRMESRHIKCRNSMHY